MQKHDIIRRIIDHEGGYVNHPNDPGGCTNMGITLKTLQNYRRDNAVDCTDVKNLTKEEAIQIYSDKYWNETCDFLVQNGSLATCTLYFTMCVMSGHSRANKLLQIAAGAKPDGIIGPNTRHKVSQIISDSFYCTAKGYLFGLTIANPKLKVFLKGWLNRINSL